MTRRALTKSKSWKKKMPFDSLRRHRLIFEEAHLLRHFCGMTVAQMAIDAHRQRTAVFVAKPARYGRNVNASFNAARGEQVAQVVVGDSLHFDGFCRAGHGLQTFLHLHHRLRQRLVWPFRFQVFQKLLHFRYHRDSADAPIFRSGFVNAANNDFVFFKIAIRPSDVARFGNPKSAKRQKANKVGTLARIAAIRLSISFKKSSNCFALGSFNILGRTFAR